MQLAWREPAVCALEPDRDARRCEQVGARLDNALERRSVDRMLSTATDGSPAAMLTLCLAAVAGGGFRDFGDCFGGGFGLGEGRNIGLSEDSNQALPADDWESPHLVAGHQPQCLV